jgi:hypothetical protein
MTKSTATIRVGQVTTRLFGPCDAARLEREQRATEHRSIQLNVTWPVEDVYGKLDRAERKALSRPNAGKHSQFWRAA